MALEADGEAGEQPVLTSVQVTACGGALEFTAAETSLLRSLPEGSEPLEPATWCELETGHPGPHYGLGQISGRTWWWLRWSDSGERRELVDAGFCGAHPQHAQGECSLPGDHVGHHDFELAAAD